MQIGVTLGIIAVVGSPALLFPETVLRLTRLAGNGDSPHMPALLGLLAGVLVPILTRKSQTHRFLIVHHHELTHLLFVLLMFGRPRSFTSNRAGGQLEFDRLRGPWQKARTFLINIAPRWFSPLALLPVGACFWHAHPGTAGWLSLGVASGLALTLPHCRIPERQSDLTACGAVAPRVASLWLWAAQAVILSTLLTTSSFAEIPTLYALAWAKIVT